MKHKLYEFKSKMCQITGFQLNNFYICSFEIEIEFLAVRVIVNVNIKILHTLDGYTNTEKLSKTL